MTKFDDEFNKAFKRAPATRKFVEDAVKMIAEASDKVFSEVQEKFITLAKDLKALHDNYNDRFDNIEKRLDDIEKRLDDIELREKQPWKLP